MHQERAASAVCGICGVRHCDDCAPRHPFVGEPVCPACAPAVRRRVVEYGASTQRTHRPSMGWLALGLAGVLCVVGVLLLVPGGEEREIRVDDRAAHLRDAYGSLELVALALESFRVREGSYPASLGLLVPADLQELPTDPFRPDGGPLSYVVSQEDARSGGRFLYSVGPDGLDHGGRPRDHLTGLGDLLYPVW